MERPSTFFSEKKVRLSILIRRNILFCVSENLYVMFIYWRISVFYVMAVCPKDFHFHIQFFHTAKMDICFKMQITYTVTIHRSHTFGNCIRSARCCLFSEVDRDERNNNTLGICLLVHLHVCYVIVFELEASSAFA